MILKKGTFADFAERVKFYGRKIIVYGAGVIGKTAAPYWLHEYQLDKNILCYVDADTHKQGTNVRVGDREIEILPLRALTENREYILLITVSAFAPVIESLERIQGTEKTEAYFLPVMLIDMAHKPHNKGVYRASDRQLIPKKIHYCWFSGNPMPQMLQRCIDSWKRFCPDYEIIRWDESNYDISWSQYMCQAYDLGKWGFVSDVARLDILYRHGGIYFDTDVELTRSLDELLYQSAFCGTEKWGIINTGGGCGAQPYNQIIRTLLDGRNNVSFLEKDGNINTESSGFYDTHPLINLGLKVNGQTQIIGDGKMTVYSSDFFQPFDYTSGETIFTQNTFSIHYFNGSWLGEKGSVERERTRQCYQDFVNGLEV